MRAFLTIVRDIALLVARVVAGGTLMVHGWHRWQTIGFEQLTSMIEGAGLPGAYGLAVLTVAFELIGGLLLVFGLGTPLMGLGMIVLNVATIVIFKDGAPFGLQENGWEYNAMQAAVGALLMAFGSGRLGLDSLFLRPKDELEPDEFIEEHPLTQKEHS
ncbi:MAG TPA: DoxX family protein [Tessaracoccus flavescens]|uniref:DoxX family protein n=1 Tax=Tessaracoccus flavescens TaxID=399497 RepID=A0A921EME3_9ACTN|nr:DoxX family protein [Tessaracoccus flavescens]